jgi:hypothetical protein
MKTYKIPLVLLGFFFLLPFFTIAQPNDPSRSEIKKDSLESADRQLKADDENRMDAAKLNRKQSRAKAKEAKRVENDANDAVSESKASVRAERRAQKSRRAATKQARRAARAIEKSDSN